MRLVFRPPPILQGMPFQEALEWMLVVFSDVENLLSDGENPLEYPRAAGDINNLFPAARDELKADLAYVLRGGDPERGLPFTAVRALRRHIDRMEALASWLEALGLPVTFSRTGLVREAAAETLNHVNLLHSSVVASPAFQAMHDAFWKWLSTWQSRAYFPFMGMEPAGPVSSAGDLRRSLSAIFDGLNRVPAETAVAFDMGAPLRRRLEYDALRQVLPRLKTSPIFPLPPLVVTEAEIVPFEGSPDSRLARRGGPSARDLGPCVRILCSWRAILDVLDMPCNKENQSLVRRLHEQFEGPLLLPKKGGQPRVVQDDLLGWWNRVAEQIREHRQRGTDRTASVSVQVDFGRDETVVPEINGHVRTRRKKD